MNTPRNGITAALTCLLAAAALAADPGAAPGDPAVAAVVPSSGAPGATTLNPLAPYSAFGSSLARTGHFSQLGWTQAQFEAFLDGIRAAYEGRPYPMDDAAQRLAADTSRRIGEIAARETQAAPGPADQKARLEAYFKDMRRRLGLQVSASGLAYNVEPGRNGIRPRPGDTIVFTCRATAADGTTAIPQLSAERIRVKMQGMLPGLMEGLQMMTVGSQAVFILPPSLSFPENQWPDGVARGSPLVYWVVLHDVAAAAPP